MTVGVVEAAAAVRGEGPAGRAGLQVDCGGSLARQEDQAVGEGGPPAPVVAGLLGPQLGAGGGVADGEVALGVGVHQVPAGDGALDVVVVGAPVALLDPHGLAGADADGGDRGAVVGGALGVAEVARGDVDVPVVDGDGVLDVDVLAEPAAPHLRAGRRVAGEEDAVVLGVRQVHPAAAVQQLGAGDHEVRLGPAGLAGLDVVRHERVAADQQQAVVDEQGGTPVLVLSSVSARCHRGWGATPAGGVAKCSAAGSPEAPPLPPAAGVSSPSPPFPQPPGDAPADTRDGDRPADGEAQHPAPAGPPGVTGRAEPHGAGQGGGRRRRPWRRRSPAQAGEFRRQACRNRAPAERSRRQACHTRAPADRSRRQTCRTRARGGEYRPTACRVRPPASNPGCRSRTPAPNPAHRPPAPDRTPPAPGTPCAAGAPSGASRSRIPAACVAIVEATADGSQSWRRPATPLGARAVTISAGAGRAAGSFWRQARTRPSRGAERPSARARRARPGRAAPRARRRRRRRRCARWPRRRGPRRGRRRPPPGRRPCPSPAPGACSRASRPPPRSASSACRPPPARCRSR